MQQNPEMLSNIMGMMGGAGGAGAGAGANVNDQLEQFLATPAGQTLAADPIMQPVIDDIRANGMAAAAKYANNPEVMGKLSALLGANQ